jgi:hypothetical protein
MTGNYNVTTTDTLTITSANVTAPDDGSIETINTKVTSTSDPTGITLVLTETGLATNFFTGVLGFDTVSSDSGAGKILVTEGDFFTITDPSQEYASNGIIIPNYDLSNGAILVGGFPSGGSATATYQSVDDTVTILDQGASGGGGGGLVRPSLVVNALAGVGSLSGSGGGSAYSSPTLQLSNLVKLGIVDVPLEVEDMIYSHDATIPTTTFDLDHFENFDFPLIINDKGFVLSGFSTTLETQTLTTNTPNTIKFLFYEGDKIQHFSLYTNLRDANTAIHQSDTQILYFDGAEIDVVDPNGFFETVDFTLNEIDDIKKEIILEITFANPMEKTDIIIRSWDPFLNSFDTHILDAIEVVPDVIEESPITTYSEPVIEELKSQTIPIWIKNNASWWSEEQIDDSDFIAGIEYLIKNGIINVPGVQVGVTSTSEVPDWIQNNAAWWSESLITDADFVEAMQWLVANGVIQI